MSTIPNPSLIADLHRNAAVVADLTDHASTIIGRFNPSKLGMANPVRAEWARRHAAATNLHDHAEALLLAYHQLIDELATPSRGGEPPAVTTPADPWAIESNHQGPRS